MSVSRKELLMDSCHTDTKSVGLSYPAMHSFCQAEFNCRIRIFWRDKVQVSGYDIASI